MMKIGIEQDAYKIYGFSQGIARMRKHGYECLDYGDFIQTDTELFRLSDSEFEKTLRAQRAEVEDAGIEISQTHGPWRWPPQDYTPEQRAERFEKMVKSIRGTAILGCRNFVIHPIMPFGDDNDPDPKALWEINSEFMGRLAEAGKEYGVVVNFENMPMTALSISRADAILKFVKNINNPFFRICLDTGHCAVFGDSPADAVRAIGKEYLASLHVHDNDGHRDLHLLPYHGVIDWNDFSSALIEIGFEGALSLETMVPAKVPMDIRESQEISLFQMGQKIARR